METADNLKTQTAYIHINGAINKTFLNRHPHELAPGHNLHKIPNIESWTPDTIIASYQAFPYKSSLPTPILFPEHANKTPPNYFNDPALQLVLEKEKWFKRKRKMKKIWREDKELSRHCSVKTKTDASCPKFLVDFTELLSSDPDPNFCSAYNWYYTDGTLNIANDNGSEILIHSSGFHDTYLHVTPITKSKDKYILNDTLKQSSIQLENKQPIFQIISSIKNNDKLLIGMRQRKSFHICYFTAEDKDNKIIKVKEVAGNNTLTSVALEDACRNSICLADTDDSLDIYDLSTLNELRNINLTTDENLVDKWSSIKYYDPYTLISVNRNSMHIFDIRSDDSEISAYKPTLISDKCDEMSVFQFSKFQKNLLYIGTNHSLFSYDIRMLREIHPLQRWTHNMKSTPHLIDLGAIDNNEVIILSSPLCNEIRFIVNSHMKKMEDEISSKSNEIIVQSPCSPWQPPSLADSLLLSRSQGNALKPSKYLRERMNFCNCGINSISKEETIHLFIQNSVGDVFQQEIKSADHQFDNNDVPKALSNWIEDIEGNSPLFATNLINLKPILSILKSDANNSDAPNKTVKEKWRRPLGELREYRDVLAADLLSAWNLTEDKGDIPSQLHKNSTTTEEKVSAWLQSAPVGENNPMNIFINEHMENVALNRSYNYMSQPVIPSAIFEPMLTSSQPVTRPKKTVQKRKHFEGF